MTHNLKSKKSHLLRWAGSKIQSAQILSKHLSFDRPYIEPFCGSASFFFLHQPRTAKLNDNNRNLINFYKVLQKKPEQLWNVYSRQRVGNDAYYRIRKRFNSLEHGARKAAYFLYLNHFCFNGLYRTNKSGEFNTPIGSHDQSKTKLSLEQIMKYASVARNASFHASDFEEFLDKAAPAGACIYVDPPYFTHDARVFDEYGQRSFDLRDLRRLGAVAKRHSRRNLVVISYKDCTEFRALFADHIVRSVSVTRNVGGFVGRRKVDTELIAVLGSA